MEPLELLRARLSELARRAENGRPAYTSFLSPEEQRFAADAARAERLPPPLFWGGTDGAERKIAGFAPDFLAEEDFRAASPIRLLHAHAAADGLSHRDYLGALMALGLVRKAVGDLYIDGLDAYLFLTKEGSAAALRELSKVGRIPVALTELSVEQAVLPARQEEPMRFTVASLRLDAAISGMFRLSRAEAAEKIRQGLVFVGGLPCEKLDRPVSAGDTLSLRGEGKGQIVSCDGRSRKGRIFVDAIRFR